MPPEIPFKVEGQIPYQGMVYDNGKMLVRRADTHALMICRYMWYHKPFAWWWRRQNKPKVGDGQKST